MIFGGGSQTRSTAGPLTGRTIVISGTFTRFTRDELKAAVEKAGGKISSSVSGNTSFIIAGNDMGPSKRTKAAELGVPLVSEEEFVKMIQ